MKFKTGSKRLTRAVVVGLLGVCVLSVSAFAAWGSTSGYGKYKDAVTKVFTETDNVTIDADCYLIYDGDKAYRNITQWKIDGNDYTRYDKDSGENSIESYTSVIGKTQINMSTDSKYYYQYEVDPAENANPLNLGDYSVKLLNFGKLCADTVLGDLKNNVVLADEKDGMRTYSLDVTADQMPALVTSGLDLLMAGNSSNGGYVTYDDSDKSYAAYCANVKGKPLPDDYFTALDSGEGTDAMWDAYNEGMEEMYEYYDAFLDGKGENAVISVKEDGSYAIYDDYADYVMAECYGTNDLNAYLGTNAVLKNVSGSFTLDSRDRLVANDLTVAFEQTDKSGSSHEVKLVVDLKFSDYETTKVAPFDVGDRTLYVDQED